MRYDDEVQELERITVDSAIMGGKPCIRGMRVTVGMIVEAIAVSTMVCNDLVMPLLLKSRHFANRNLAPWLLGIRRAVEKETWRVNFCRDAAASQSYGFRPQLLCQP